MKILFAIIFSTLSTAASAGILAVRADESGSSLGGEVRYFKLETHLGKPHLFVLDSSNQACRVPVELFKELGIDPVQFGMSLRNVKGNDGIILTCYITAEEMGKRFFAYKIEVTSWPRP